MGQYFFVVLGISFLFAVSFIVHVSFIQAFCKTGMEMFYSGMTILFLVTAIYYPVRLLGIDKGWDTGSVTAWFLFPSIAVSHLFWEFQEADSIGIPLSFEDPLIQNAVWMMAVDIIFWGALGFYFEQIMPQAHGPAFESNPLFFLTSKWWTKNPNSEIDEDNMLRLGEGSGVEIQNLVKEFDSKDAKGKKIKLRAVDDLSVSFKSGNITAVLGHNGAGKTTTIRCMTASHSVTSGKILIDGVSVSENPAWVRQHVGVCPQHDVLYLGLTAREHIELFGALKGDRDIEGALAGVDLLEKADELVDSFSGGQKRRLSVAISLLGDPKLIVLDEPTTGMDVVARQSVWNMVESRKKGRCIILTTHSMEEADALGDEVVVLGKGKVQAHGTSIDLKNSFGIGFHLHIVKQLNAMKNNQFQQESVVNMIGEHVGKDAVKLLTDIGAEISFAIPRDKTPTFPDLFTALGENKEKFGIEQVALSQTTLEEVFMELGRKEEEEEKKKELEKQGETDEEGVANTSGDEENATPGDGGKVVEANDAIQVGSSATGGTSAGQTYGGLYLVINSYKRDPGAICCLIIWPIMLGVIAGIIYATRQVEILESVTVVPYDNPPASFPYVIVDSTQSIYASKYVENITSVTGSNAVKYETKDAMDAALSAGEGLLGYQFGIVFDSLKYNGTKLDALSIDLLINDTDIEFKQARQIAAMVTNVGIGVNGKAMATPTYIELEKGPSAQVNAVAWGAGGLMIVISPAFAYLSAFYSEGMARDRILGRRVHLFVSSMGRPAYYMGRFVADFVSLLLPLLLTPIIMAIFAFPSVLNSNIGAYFLLVICFAPSGVAFGYVI